MTKAKFKIVRQPETRIHHAFLFPDIHVGYQACREIVQAVKPSIVRLFDEAETVSIIKKIIGFEKRGSFLNLTLEGYEKVVAAELEIVLDIAKKYGAEDLGTEYGEKWFQNRITFFYPDNIMDLPQMFGTLDTVATHDNIEKIYLNPEAPSPDNPNGHVMGAHGLPQTGQLNWPIPVLAVTGVVLVAAGIRLKKGTRKDEK